jgi:hypothetical protein
MMGGVLDAMKGGRVPEQDIIPIDPEHLPDRKTRRRRSAQVERLVKILVDSADSGSWYCVPEVAPEKKSAWMGKIGYAARIAGREVESFYVHPDNAGKYTPGLYFRGHHVGDAPPRGRRKKVSEFELKKFSEI